MRKKYKLIFLGITSFLLFLVLILFYFGVIKIGQPAKCEGLCKWASEAKVLEETIIVENNKLSVKEIVIKKETGSIIFIDNRDSKTHYITQQYLKGKEYTTARDFIVNPQKRVSLIGLFNPPKDLNAEPGYIKVLPDKNAIISTPVSQEYRIICNSCEIGFKTVRLVLE
ncbi:MAG: hypothetical protein N3F05_04135 [Candidatus Diapherotrites archaeon]|nr:hypothetical protein [Candidatus Diapherotrites archaeon]